MSVSRNMQQFVKAYQSDALEAKVLGANPAELVELMYRGAIDSLHEAALSIASKDFSRKSQQLNKATDIIGSLNMALNHQAGGQISSQLASLYDYWKRRLMDAGLSNDQAVLTEVISQLDEIRGAWEIIGRDVRSKGSNGGRNGGIAV